MLRTSRSARSSTLELPIQENNSEKRNRNGPSPKFLGKCWPSGAKCQSANSHRLAFQLVLIALFWVKNEVCGHFAPLGPLASNFEISSVRASEVARWWRNQIFSGSLKDDIWKMKYYSQNIIWTVNTLGTSPLEATSFSVQKIKTVKIKYAGFQ